MNPMRKTAYALFVLVASSTSVMAAEVIDLSVKGMVRPAACVPSLAGGGVLDYGDIHSSKLSQDDYTLLPAKPIGLSISCFAPTKFGIGSSSNRKGSALGTNEEDSKGFARAPVRMLGWSADVAGLGLAENDAKIGGFVIRLLDGTSFMNGGVRVNPLLTINDGSSWKHESEPMITSADHLVSWGRVGTTLPIAMTNLTVELRSQTFLNKLSELDVSQSVEFNGSVTIEVVYL